MPCIPAFTQSCHHVCHEIRLLNCCHKRLPLSLWTTRIVKHMLLQSYELNQIWNFSYALWVQTIITFELMELSLTAASSSFFSPKLAPATVTTIWCDTTASSFNVGNERNGLTFGQTERLSLLLSCWQQLSKETMIV